MAPVAAWYAAHTALEVFIAVAKVAIVVGSIVYSQQQARKLRNSLKSLSSLQASAQGRNVTYRDSAAYHQIVYGECRVGGIIAFNENYGPNNEYKHLVIIFAGHEVEGLSGMLLDDESVQFDAYGNAVGKYAGYFSAFFFNGSENQTALYELKFDHPGKWTDAHRLRGLAGIYVRLKVNSDLFPNGVPNITVVCRGKKVFDPRVQQYVWTSNAALCLADYYCDKKHGLGFDFDADIDVPELIASANVCDERVTLADGVTTEARYSCNGVFSADTLHSEVIEHMKAAMAGFTIDPPGKVGIVAGYWRPPTLPAFDEDTLCDGLTVATKPNISSNFNSVKGMFINPKNGWQATDYPPVKNATYLAQDSGIPMPREITYNFVTSSAQAQRLGKIALEEVRQGITVQGTGKMHWFQVRAGDVIQFTNARRGWNAKNFFVESISIATDDAGAITFPFTLRETAAGIYDWNNGEETVVDLAPNTNLPSAFDIKPPTNIQVVSDSTTVETNPDGTYVPRIKVTWDLPADEFVRTGGLIWIQYKRTDQTDWASWIPVDGRQSFVYIFPVITDAIYSVRIRSQNRLGVRSEWVYSDPTAIGDTTPPDGPTSFQARDGVGGISLSWTNGSSPDLDRTEIMERTAAYPPPSVSSGPSYVTTGNSAFIPNIPVGTTRYYWIRAVDQSGNRSSYSAMQSATSRAEFVVSASPASQSLYGTVPSAASLFLQGSVSATATGGVAPYTYQWSGGSEFDNTLPVYTEFFNFTVPMTRTTRVKCTITDSRGVQLTTGECVIQYTAASS